MDAPLFLIFIRILADYLDPRYLSFFLFVTFRILFRVSIDGGESATDCAILCHSPARAEASGLSRQPWSLPPGAWSG